MTFKRATDSYNTLNIGKKFKPLNNGDKIRILVNLYPGINGWSLNGTDYLISIHSGHIFYYRENKKLVEDEYGYTITMDMLIKYPHMWERYDI